MGQSPPRGGFRSNGGLGCRYVTSSPPGCWLWLGETTGQVIEHEVPGYDRPWARIFERFERQMQRPAKPDIFSFD